MSKIDRIVIGVPARNEEKAIKKSLGSIRDAILFTERNNISLVVCVNGCTDKTQELAEEFKDSFRDIDCQIIESTPGLVAAQRRITESYPADVFVFADSDNVIERDSIELLLAALEADPDLLVVYAKTIPLEIPGNNSLFHKIGLLYDSQKLLTKRYYFHGRLFAIKDWFVPDNKEILSRANRNKSSKLLLAYSRDNMLLYADDIYLSSYIMDKYGINTIKQIEDAHCYSWSVGSFRDWWNTYRRRNIEMEKMYLWFPEFNYLKPYLNRYTDWREWLKAPINEKILWLIFLSMRAWFYINLRIELLLNRSSYFRPRDQWQITTTTKNEIK